jgi:hypothetical protein
MRAVSVVPERGAPIKKARRSCIAASIGAWPVSSESRARRVRDVLVAIPLCAPPADTAPIELEQH